MTNRLSPEDSSSRPIVVERCSICKKPVFAGEARYTVTNNHYECQFPGGRQSFDDLVDELDSRLESLTGRKRRRASKPIGQGAIALKAQAKVLEALKKFYAEEPSDIVVWVQPPAYRGDKWDLARWGLNCRFGRMPVTCYSWATMTECAKSKNLTVTNDGISGSFDIGTA